MESASDSGIVGSAGSGPEEAALVVRPRRRAKRQRSPQLASRVWAAIIGVGSPSPPPPPRVQGLVLELAAAPPAASSSGALVPVSSDAVGVVCGLVELVWEVAPPAAETDEPARSMQDLAAVAQRRRFPFYVQYRVQCAQSFSEGPLVIRVAGVTMGRRLPAEVQTKVRESIPDAPPLVALVVWMPLGTLTVQGRWPIAHCLGFSGSSQRFRRGLGGVPSLSDALVASEALAEDRLAQGSAAEASSFALVSRGPQLAESLEPHVMARFVRGSRHLKSLRNSEEAVTYIMTATLLGRSVNESGRVKWPGRSCLQSARVRFDLAIMLAMREISRSNASSNSIVNFYVFLDGSPASGFEAFAIAARSVRLLL